MTPLDVLLAVRSLLSREEAWIKGACPLRAADGRAVSVWHPHACKFTLAGAFARIQHYTKTKAAEEAATLLCKQIDPKEVISLASYNDALGTTHYSVLCHLDRAISSLGGTPPQVEEE